MVKSELWPYTLNLIINQDCEDTVIAKFEHLIKTVEVASIFYWHILKKRRKVTQTAGVPNMALTAGDPNAARAAKLFNHV